MRYSRLSPSTKILNVLNVEYSERYDKVMTSYSRYEPLDSLNSDSRYTPLFLKALDKALKQISLDDYNERLDNAVKKTTLDRKHPLFEFETYLIFYGYTREAKKLNKTALKYLDSGSQNQSEYVGLLHYLFIHSNIDLRKFKNIRFPKLDLYFSAETLFILDPRITRPTNLGKALVLLANNYSPSEFLFINSVMKEMNFPFFKDAGQEGGILFNSAVYQMLMEYSFSLKLKLYALMESEKEHNEIRLKEFVKGSYLEFFDYYINTRKSFDNPLKLSHKEYGKKLTTSVDVVKILLTSDFPFSEWDPYMDIPFEWLKAIASDK